MQKQYNTIWTNTIILVLIPRLLTIPVYCDPQLSKTKFLQAIRQRIHNRPAPNLRSIYKQRMERINIPSSWKMSQAFYFGMPRKSTNHAHHNPAGISVLKLFHRAGVHTRIWVSASVCDLQCRPSILLREKFPLQVYGHCLLRDVKGMNESLNFEQIRKLGICAR